MIPVRWAAMPLRCWSGEVNPLYGTRNGSRLNVIPFQSDDTVPVSPLVTTSAFLVLVVCRVLTGHATVRIGSFGYWAVPLLPPPLCRTYRVMKDCRINRTTSISKIKPSFPSKSSHVPLCTCNNILPHNIGTSSPRFRAYHHRIPHTMLVMYPYPLLQFTPSPGRHAISKITFRFY